MQKLSSAARGLELPGVRRDKPLRSGHTSGFTIPWASPSPRCGNIEDLSAKGEGPIEVIQWPAGKVVFTDGQWKDGVASD